MDLEDLDDVIFDREERHDDNQNEEPIEEYNMDEEGEQFDISLPASHSYMGSELNDLSGRVVLEAGWRGRVPALAHHGVLFPGETVPMLLNNNDATLVAEALVNDKLFALLCPDESCSLLSGYGVICEVFEAALNGAAEQRAVLPSSVSFKARVLHRIRLVDKPDYPMPVALFVRMQYMNVVVLPEVQAAHPLRHTRLASLYSARRHQAGLTQQETRVRRLDAALTPWPHFVYEIFDYSRMRSVIHRHFTTLGLEQLLPSDPVSLSFWVASNLAVGARDRLALFVVDNAMVRLHMECRLIARKSMLCCATCWSDIARREDTFAMSTDGAHGNYTNPGGFMHDVLTVSSTVNTRTAGAPSEEFSWFPGYRWTVCVCARCSQHVGWRFDAGGCAGRRALKPRRFYAVCRNYVVPRENEPQDGALLLPSAAPDMVVTRLGD